MTGMSKVVVIDTFEKWKEILVAWNDLLMQSRSNTLFLRWEWLYTWAECFLQTDQKLFILAVYGKGNENLIGLAPFYLHLEGKGCFSLRQIRFLGSPQMASEYLDVFARKGKEKEVALQIYRFIYGEASKLWDNALLEDIPADSLFLLHFLESLKEEGKYIEMHEGAFCPTVILKPSWADLLVELSSNRREQFRRHYRRLQKHGKLSHSTLDQGKNALSRFNALYSSWWGKNQDDQFYAHLEKFIDISHSESLLQLDFLSIDKRDVAGLLHFRDNGNLMMYLMAVDKEFDPRISIGNVLVGLCLEKAVCEGFNKYDFLRGSESYKFHWANGGRRSIVLNIYQKRVGALYDASIKMCKNFGRILFR